MTQATLPAEKKHAALSRELSEFLIELSIAVHRYAMYPPGHPSLGPAVENVVGRLAEIFENRRAVSIGVAHRQLVIEGVATDPRHPVLSDLARRLHNHQLGALSFAVGTNAREVEGMLALLARESEREGDPIGLTPSRIPTWDHARVYPVGYDQLEMKSSQGEDEDQHMDRATQLWLGLAQSALASDEPVDPNASPDAKSLAAAIDGHRREAADDQVIVGYLLQLVDELKTGQGGEAEKVRRRVSALVNELGDGTLARLVEMGGNKAQRRQFLLDANQGLAVDAVVKVLRAAAERGGQSISTSMTRLLSKLAVHADKGTDYMRARADTALRENVEELIAGWKLADPNPDQYTAVLDAMAKSSPLFQIRVERDECQMTGPMRVVQLAIEVDAWGPTVQTAVGDMLGLGMASSLIQLIDQAPSGTKVAEEVRRHLTSPT